MLPFPWQILAVIMVMLGAILTLQYITHTYGTYLKTFGPNTMDSDTALILLSSIIDNNATERNYSTTITFMFSHSNQVVNKILQQVIMVYWQLLH